MQRKYVAPDQVNSPRKRWTLVSVLYDGGDSGWSAAIGRWDGHTMLAIRWNGTEGNSNGSPQSRGLPTWHMVPEELRQANVDRILEFCAEKKPLVEDFFKTK